MFVVFLSWVCLVAEGSPIPLLWVSMSPFDTLTPLASLALCAGQLLCRVAAVLFPSPPFQAVHPLAFPAAPPCSNRPDFWHAAWYGPIDHA